MSPMRNVTLETWMKEHGYSSNDLAEAVNREAELLTGRLGGHDGSSVRTWKSGRVKWPNSVTRLALEKITGLSARELGFVPRSSTGRCQPHQEDPLKRRSLVGGAVAAAAAAAPGLTAPRRIGMSDVDRLNQRFVSIIASDHRYGGQRGIEQRAANLAQEALVLQNVGSATQRVRSSLYACAAGFASSAMWAAIDGRRYTEALAHMREAQALAEMSREQAIKFRIWSHSGVMYRHLGRPADALAANDVARNLGLVRRDPMFASLGLARQAAIHGVDHDRSAVQRAYGEAQEALARAETHADRPVWLVAFYDQAELHGLALTATLSLGDYQTAEYHAHRCLAELRPHMIRSKAITTTRLAHAQLAQGDAEAATATAMTVSAEAATQHVRVSGMLQEFGAALRAMAPGKSTVDAWTEHTASWRTNA